MEALFTQVYDSEIIRNKNRLNTVYLDHRLGEKSMKKHLPPMAVMFCLSAVMAPVRAEWVASSFVNGITIRALVVSGNLSFAGGNGLYRSADGGPTWQALSSGLPATNIESLGRSGTMLFTGTYSGGIYASTNNGNSWYPVNTGLPHNPSSELTLLHAYAFAALDSSLFAGTSEGVFRTTNNGASWVAVNAGLPTNRSEAGDFIVGAFGAALFAATGPGEDEPVLFRSANKGESWTGVTPGVGNLNVNAFAVMGTSLFAGTSGGVFRTTDGSNWTAVKTGLPDQIFSLAVFGTLLFAGSYSGGIYQSADSGTSWFPVNAGLPTIASPFPNTEPLYEAVWALAVSGSNILAGTSSGVRYRPLSELATLVAAPSRHPSTNFRLDGTTGTIAFTLPAQSSVVLKVFDPSGREQALLLSEMLAAGSHTRGLNLSNLPKGLYFVRLQTSTYTETKKLLVSR